MFGSLKSKAGWEKEGQNRGDAFVVVRQWREEPRRSGQTGASRLFENT